VLALIALVVASCGSDDSAATTSLPATTTTTAATTTPTTDTTTTNPETTTTTVDPGERMFGWLRSFEDTGAETFIMVDEAEMLSGEEAVLAARQDGVIGPDEDLPNDYYIRDPDGSTVELTVAPDVVVTLQACYEDGECVTTEQVDLATWSVLLGAEDDPGLAWTWYGGGSLPYWFTVQGNTVGAVDEQYLP
jgi:hypothetical protein